MGPRLLMKGWLGKEAVCPFFGEKRGEQRGGMWREGTEQRAGQHVHIGGKDI